MVRCFYKKQGEPIKDINSGLCMGSGSSAGFFSCCFPWDKCLKGGVCRSDKNDSYYTALCTDQTLQDPVCQKGCGGNYNTNLTWNSAAENWDCNSDKSKATLDAPAPEKLIAQTLTIVDFIPTSTETSTSVSTSTSRSGAAASSSTTTDPNSTPRPSADAINTISQSGSSGLSTGAKAGIGVGVTGAVLAIIAAVVLLVLWRRNRRRTDPKPIEKGNRKSEVGETTKPSYPSEHPDNFGYGLREKAELSSIPQNGQRGGVELPGQETASEMDSGYSGSHQAGGRSVPDWSSSR